MGFIQVLLRLLGWDFTRVCFERCSVPFMRRVVSSHHFVCLVRMSAWGAY